MQLRHRHRGAARRSANTRSLARDLSRRQACVIDRPASLPPRLEDLLASLMFISVAVLHQRAYVELSNEQCDLAVLVLSIN